MMILREVLTGRVWEQEVTDIDHRHKKKDVSLKSDITLKDVYGIASDTVAVFNHTLGEDELSRVLVEVYYQEGTD